MADQEHAAALAVITSEMLDAGADQIGGGSSLDREDWLEYAENVYRAMLAARPAVAPAHLRAAVTAAARRATIGWIGEGDLHRIADAALTAIAAQGYLLDEPIRPAPLTARDLADAFAAAWNAAIGTAHERQAGMDTACVVASAFGAVAAQLTEVADREKAR